MTNITLLDSDTGNMYTIDVSEEDAAKASQDILFATQLLDDHKATMVQSHDELVAETESSSSSSYIHHIIEEAVQEEVILSDSSQEKDSFRWPHEAILLLLTMYKEKEGRIASGKMTMKKFWIMIASNLVEKGYNVTGSQCKSKMAGLKNTYKNVKDHNYKSGSNIRAWQYFDIMDELFKNKWVAPVLSLEGSNPTSSISENYINKKRHGLSSYETKLPSKRSKECILLEKVLTVAKQSVTERRRMHNEAMARHDKLLDILEKMVKK